MPARYDDVIAEIGSIGTNFYATDFANTNDSKSMQKKNYSGQTAQGEEGDLLEKELVHICRAAVLPRLPGLRGEPPQEMYGGLLFPYAHAFSDVATVPVRLPMMTRIFRVAQCEVRGARAVGCFPHF